MTAKKLTAEQRAKIHRYAELKRREAAIKKELASLSGPVLALLITQEGDTYRHNGPKVTKPYTFSTRVNVSWDYDADTIEAVSILKAKIKAAESAAQHSRRATGSQSKSIVFTDGKG